MTPYITLACTGSRCRAELRVPKADADKYGPFLCERCEDQQRIDGLIQQFFKEHPRNEPKQSAR